MLRSMDSITKAQLPSTTWSAHLPGWTRPRTIDFTEADAAFVAGIALKSLDDLIRGNPPWVGCWRDRLALKSATVAARMLGRNEDGHALRDAILLTTTGDDPGPAGKLFLATRMLARQRAGSRSRSCWTRPRRMPSGTAVTALLPMSAWRQRRAERDPRRGAPTKLSESRQCLGSGPIDLN